MFWKKKENSLKYDDSELLRRIEKIEAEIKILKNHFLDLESSHDLIRDKVLRRFKEKREQKEPTSPLPPQDINSFFPKMGV